MDVDAARPMLRHFDDLEDPRMERTRLHSLNDILFITLCAVLCGANRWTEVQVYGKARWDWLKTVLLLPNGIPAIPAGIDHTTRSGACLACSTPKHWNDVSSDGWQTWRKPAKGD